MKQKKYYLIKNSSNSYVKKISFKFVNWTNKKELAKKFYQKNTALKYLNILKENDYDCELEEDYDVKPDKGDKECLYCGSKQFYLVGYEEYHEYYHFNENGELCSGLEDATEWKGEHVDCLSREDTLRCSKCGKFFREITKDEESKIMNSK